MTPFDTKIVARQWVKQQWPTVDWPMLSAQAQQVLMSAWPVITEPLHRVSADCPPIHCLGYQPINGELDVGPSLARLPLPVDQCWLPKVQGQHLWAGQWSATRVIPGAYGIKEPVDGLTNHWQHLDPLVLFIPCLAVSTSGYRLGRGKGYYDRLLTTLQQLNTRYIAIGVCPKVFHLNPEATWPVDDWDSPLHGALSERGITWFRAYP
jgi:5-formyltetrahydrofolate cyclo-ligase